MIGTLVSKLCVALGFRKAAPTNTGSPSGSEGEEIVTRHGLSHADAPDPVSGESHIEIERQKGFRSGPR